MTRLRPPDESVEQPARYGSLSGVRKGLLHKRIFDYRVAFARSSRPES